MSNCRVFRHDYFYCITFEMFLLSVIPHFAGPRSVTTVPVTTGLTCDLAQSLFETVLGCMFKLAGTIFCIRDVYDLAVDPTLYSAAKVGISCLPLGPWGYVIVYDVHHSLSLLTALGI